MPDQAESKKNELKMKNIEDLNGLHFVIPSYQRGYRWTTEQVTALINDIQEFADKKDKVDKEFYCLQPIVVKPREVTMELNCSLETDEQHLEGGEIQIQDSGENIRTYKYDPSVNKFTATEYEVIDGQQRLTTIFLILKKLKEKNPFALEYDTRNETTQALNNPEKASDERIDEWHIKQTWKIIDTSSVIQDKNWQTTFLKQTQVIWYEPEKLGTDDVESIKIFSRLNVGKIPLTNSELIRALFILKTKDKLPSELNEYKIASEWDFIEQQLHNDEFWCFCNLGNPFKKEYPNRIEFFFNLIEQRPENKTDQSHQTYSTFAMYSKKITEKEKVDELWQEIKTLYYRFHEWFIDDNLYHLIGFIRLNHWKSLTELLKDADDQKQSKLQRDMLILVKEKVKLEEMNNWCYGENSTQIQNALLLFNLFSYQKEGRRFPWLRYLFKLDGGHRLWSLEHINAQNQQDLDDNDWLKWARYFENVELKEIVNKANESNPLTKEIKGEFTKKLEKLQGAIEEEYENHISNLSLLDRDDNSALGNRIFSKKREKIRAFSQSPRDHFIPLTTKNVFMKFYGTAETMGKWDKGDCETYYKAIAEIFNVEFPELNLSTQLSKKDANNG